MGQRFTSKTHLVGAAQIKTFARQFDPQPFHLDDDAANDSLFSGLVASGWHTAAITMRLLVERLEPGDILDVEATLNPRWISVLSVHSHRASYAP